MSQLVLPGNMLLGSVLSLEHATTAISIKDLIKMQNSRLDYTKSDTYVTVPAGKVLAIDFQLPEKAFVEKIRVYYAPEGLTPSFDGHQEIQPYLCYMTKNTDGDDTPLVLRDPYDFNNTFRDPSLCTPKLVDGLDKDYTGYLSNPPSGWTYSNPNYAFQTSGLWNSFLIDFGLVKPITYFILYSPNYMYVSSGSIYNFSAFGYWYNTSSDHGEVYSSLDGVRFTKVTDLLKPHSSYWGRVPGFTGGKYNTIDIGDLTISSSQIRRCPGYFNNTDAKHPHMCRYLKFSQNGARMNNFSITDINNHRYSYGMTEVDFYQYFSVDRLVEAIYFRDDKLINIAQHYAGYQVPDPVDNPTMRYQDLYINDITDKVRVNFTAHPSYGTWIGGIVAFGSYSALNFGRGSDNEVKLLDSPVDSPGTAQPIVINNDSDNVMTDVEVVPGFDTVSDLQDVIEISQDSENWDSIFEKLGYGLCINDLGTQCGVGNPDKQYVLKCQQGFQSQCSLYQPLTVATAEATLLVSKFLGVPVTGFGNSFDNNESTYWISDNIGPNPDNHAWKYDFGTQKFISHIMVRVSTNNHKIQVSTDGSIWTFPVDNTIVYGTNSYFKVDGQYRYIRVYADGAYNTRLTEIDIFVTDNLFRDKTWILASGVQRAGVLNDLWYSIGYVPYNSNGDIELYVLRPNGLNYDLIHSSDIITVNEVGIYRHIIDRQVIVQPGDLIGLYATRCAPQLVVGTGNSYAGNGNITGTVPKSAYTPIGHKLGLSAKVGLKLNLGDLQPHTSKIILVRTNIPSSLSQQYERDIDLIVSTRADV